MKSVTVEQIIKMEPCEMYSLEYLEALRKSVCGRRKKITAIDILKSDIPDEDKAWILFREEFFTEKDLHEIAIYAAEKIALPIWEKYYPEDKRPAEAIRIKKRWLKGKATNEELKAARAAARAAAEAAAWAVAEEAARAAARAAAEAAAWAAAEEAARAAEAATWAVAEEAARAVAEEAARAAAEEAARAAAEEAARAAEAAARAVGAAARAVGAAKAAYKKILNYAKKRIK